MPSVVDAAEAAELESELDALLATEHLTETRATELFTSRKYIPLSSPPAALELLDARSRHMALLLEFKSKNPLLFHDPYVFHLAVAYMDRVLCHAKAFVTLKVSSALPMACLLISMKFAHGDDSTMVLSVTELAMAGGLSTKTKVLVAEGLVLDALEWHLNLVTPAHFIHSLDVFEAFTEDLDLVCACLPWGSVPHLKPSVLAAALTNHPLLRGKCQPAELTLAHETLCLNNKKRL